MGLQNTLRALADPIRREILSLLKAGPMSAGDICSHFTAPVGAAGGGPDKGPPGGQVYLL